MLDSYDRGWEDSSSTALPRIDSGSLRDVQIKYSGPPEELVTTQPVIIFGELRGVIISCRFKPEEVTIQHLRLNSGTLKTVLIIYSNWEPEKLDIFHGHIESGTLA